MREIAFSIDSSCRFQKLMMSLLWEEIKYAVTQNIMFEIRENSKHQQIVEFFCTIKFLMQGLNRIVINHRHFYLCKKFTENLREKSQNLQERRILSLNNEIQKVFFPEFSDLYYSQKFDAVLEINEFLMERSSV